MNLLSLKQAFLLSTLVALQGCSIFSSSDPKESEPKELKPEKEKTHIDDSVPEGDLFQNAKRLFGTGIYSVSKEYFERVAATYPSGPYAEFSELKVADAEFYGGDIATAAPLFEQFASNHPGSNDTPYALARASQCYLASSRGVGRDSSSLQKARDAAEKLLSRFPNSPYSGVAKSVRASAIEQLARNDQLIRDYYAEHDAKAAADARDVAIKAKWSALLLEMEKEKLAPQKTIGDEIRSVQEAPLTPALVGVKRIASSEASNKRSEEILPSAQIDNDVLRLQRVTCEDELLTLYFNRDIQQESWVKGLELVTTSGSDGKDMGIKISIPNSSGLTSSLICLEGKSVTVESNGTISIPESSEISALPVGFPPRLIIHSKNPSHG